MNVCYADLRALVGKRGWRALRFPPNQNDRHGISHLQVRHPPKHGSFVNGCLQSPGDEGCAVANQRAMCPLRIMGLWLAVMSGWRALELP